MSEDSTGSAAARRLRLAPGCANWPHLWQEMKDPPAAVTVMGQPQHLAASCLAIVGTRQATARGLAVAEGLARALVGAGWVIVSGMARGIDAAAHRGALRGNGATVAIMGTGSDLTYPAGHRRLRTQIEARGCTVTEYPRGTPPRRYNFPQRNRLIAGMVEGVIVVEAPVRSGALLTAYLALDLCREVFAVPGPVDSLNSRGCHRLLREGATLVESPEDVHQVLAPPRSVKCAGQSPGSLAHLPLVPTTGSAARWIWDRLDLEGLPLDKLRGRWAGDEASWAEGLVALEMAGLTLRLPGGRLARRIWRP